MTFKSDEKPRTPVAQPRVYTDNELSDLDKEITANFNSLSTRADLERFWVKDGAGAFADGVFMRRPSGFAKTDDKLWQWRRWRQRRFPFERMAAYEQWGAQNGTEQVVPRGVRRSALIAYEKAHGSPYHIGDQHVIEDVSAVSG